MTAITVRDATPADREFILALVPRLRAFGPSSLRPIDALDGAERQILDRVLATRPPDTTLVVAEHGTLGRVGVAYAETATDYFTREPHGHLGILIVAETGEGKGVGQALLAAFEEWSRKQGHRFVTLNVFAGNARAREVYERAGYWADTLRYAKQLEPRG